MVTKAGRTLYKAVTTCEREACYTHPDSGTEPCGSGFGGGGPPGGGSTDMASAAGSPECTACIADSITSNKSSCTSADSIICGTCSTEYTACLADK